MRPHDPLRTAELHQCAESKDAWRTTALRAPSAVLVIPEALEHELEVRRNDSPLAGVRRGARACAALAERDPAGSHLVEHGLYERPLGADLLAGLHAPALQR